MSSSKILMQNRLRKWKTAATQFISADDTPEESSVIELEPSCYELCRQMAEEQGTTVSAVVHYMIEQYATGRPQETMFQASLEQRERNPLLQLDALTRHASRGRDREEEPE